MRFNFPSGYNALFLNRAAGNFCFYGLRSLLVLYLTSTFLFSDQKAFDLYGTFMALAYLTPVIGGWLSDHYLGARQAILAGGVIVFIGCVSLLGSDLSSLTLGLTFISLGTGLLKPSSLASVGILFSDDQGSEKDRAYTTLYVGMNIGSALGPLFCGWIGHTYGWHYVFPIIGSVLLIACIYCFKRLEGFIQLQGPENLSIEDKLKCSILLIISAVAVWLCLTFADYLDWLMPIIITVSLLTLAIIYNKSNTHDRINLLKIASLMGLFAIFCALFEQSGSSITLFINRCVNRQFLSNQIPTEFFQSLNPILIVILGALVARQTKKDSNNDVFLKFCVGFFFVSLSFFILSWVPAHSETRLISPFWIVAVFSIQVIGELFVVPIGFSAVSKLSPKKHTSLVMGLWLVSISCGHYIASLLAKFSGLTHDKTATESIRLYQDFFGHVAILPLVVACLIGVGVITGRKFRKP